MVNFRMKLICVQMYNDDTYVFNSFFSYLLSNLKVHKIENFFGSEFEFYTISLLVMLKY